MEQNKVRTYFLYAIGEILLVVIGILIALQVNNWNEYNKEQQIAQEYLVDIINDLATDTTQFAYMTEVLTNTIESELKVLSKTEYEESDDDDLSATIIANSFRRSINHRTFNKIQNSGISNLTGFESLYDSLSNYYIETNRDLISTTEYDRNDYEKNRILFTDFIRTGQYELPFFISLLDEQEELEDFEPEYLNDPFSRNLLTDFLTTVNGRNYVVNNTRRHFYMRAKYLLYKNEASRLIEQLKHALETDV